MATVKEAVKETLVGTTREPLLSAQAKANFDRHARRDEETGELYMSADGFVNAIAPVEEDYVSHLALCHPSNWFCPQGSRLKVQRLIWTFSIAAQDQTGAICDPLQCSRPPENGQDHTARLGHLRESPSKAGCRVRDRLSVVRRLRHRLCQI